MTPTVVTAGPSTVRGPGSAPGWISAAIISAAIDCIDDPIALVDEHPVEVSELWRKVLTAAASEHADALVVVVPTWWPQGRRDVIGAAAAGVSANGVVVQRSSMYSAGSEVAVVELSAEYAVVTPPGSDAVVLSRDDPALVTHLEASTSVLLDIPAAVPGLPAAMIAKLRRLGIPVTRGTEDQLRRLAASAAHPRTSHGVRGISRMRPGRRASAVLGGTALTIAAVGGGWAAQALSDGPTRPPMDSPTRLLTEGGIAVRIPASWPVERITSGSGSARVRVAPPGGSPALHITQSAGPVGGTLADAAESLTRAMDSEPDGVFTDLDPSARRGDRPVVAYAEHRAGSVTHWAVFLDGAVRIAVGCQSADTDVLAVDDICADAVRSAHVVR